MSSSATHRIKEIKQLRGRYLNPVDFKEHPLGNGPRLCALKNIYPSVVRMAIDYMVRFMLCGNTHKAFDISFMGVHRLVQWPDNSIAMTVAR